MVDLLVLYIVLPTLSISIMLLPIVYLGIEKYRMYKRYGFFRSPPFKELHEFSSVDASTRIATFAPTKEVQEWAQQHGKYFSPYRVRVQFKPGEYILEKIIHLIFWEFGLCTPGYFGLDGAFQ